MNENEHEQVVKEIVDVFRRHKVTDVEAVGILEIGKQVVLKIDKGDV